MNREWGGSKTNFVILPNLIRNCWGCGGLITNKLKYQNGKHVTRAITMILYTVSFAIFIFCVLDRARQRQLFFALKPLSLLCIFLGVPILHIIPVPFPDCWHKSCDDRQSIDKATVHDLLKIFHVFIKEIMRA